MPKLIFVIACEKVLIEQSGPVSIISLFQKMNVQIMPGVPIPEKAIAPNRWEIFCLWENFPLEIGQEFTQVVKMTAPDGSVFIEAEAHFKNDDIENSQTKINMQFNAIPIWAEGVAEVKVWLKGVDEEAGSYRFSINYVPAPTVSVAQPLPPAL